GGAIGHRAGELPGNNLYCYARLALGAGLADADDRYEPRAPCRQSLRLHIRVGLAAGMTALGMTDDHVAATGIAQHLGADAAGEGARGRGVAILAAERDTAA